MFTVEGDFGNVHTVALRKVQLSELPSGYHSVMKSTWAKSNSMAENLIARDLISLSCVVTLAFSTSLTMDAFTPIKFACLILGIFYVYVRHWRIILSSLVSSNKLFYLTLAFFSHSLMILAVNPYSISERLFGYQGRFFGLISIWSLYLMGLAVFLTVKRNKLDLDLLLRGLMFTNLFVALVFFVQELGIGFTEFQNVYTVFPSTLGNPNFLAAFIVVSLFSSVYFLLAPKRRFSLQFWLAAASTASSLYIVAVSSSLQGPIGIGIGALSLVFLFGMRTKPKFTLTLTALLSLFSIPLIQGLFGKGIFGERIEQGTLLIRSMYWRIAARMGVDRPFSGQGFDSYLDNYRLFRSPDDVATYGTGIISDSPHNLYLDFLVSGGFPYLIWPLAGSAYVGFAAFKVLEQLKLRGLRDTSFVFLVTIWIVLTVLALINPFQLSVNIWNVVTSFAIVGFYHQLLHKKQKDLPLRKTQANNQMFIKLPLALSLIVFLNPLVAILPMATEIRFRNAVEKSDYNALREVAMDWPFSGSRVATISQGIVSSSLNFVSSFELKLQMELQDMIQVANADVLAATKINPKSFALWNFIFYNHPNSSIQDMAREKLVALDPNDPSWTTATP